MGNASNYTSANQGGIKRGDSAETGDLAARPTEDVDSAGAGTPFKASVDPSALGPSRGRTPLDGGDNDLDDLTVYDASDPTLGLTNIGEIPPDDWAADTG